MARSAEPCEVSCSIVVQRSVQQCWDTYINTNLMADWAPAVSSVESTSSVIQLNSQRTCKVSVDGKEGHTVELCTAIDPLKRIEFTVIEETFGFSHMLNSYGFNMSFDAEGSDTLMIMQTHYVPKKIFGSVMSSNATQQQLLSLMEDTLQGFKR